MSLIAIVLVFIMAIVVTVFLSHLLPVKVPLPLIQIAAGAALAASGFQVDFDPHIFLLLFIPPLLFLDGWRIPKDAFFRDMKPILSLAIGLVMVTILGIGLFIHWLIPAITVAAGFALAAILSPTDPVAVSAMSLLSPVTAVVLGWIFLGQKIQGMALMGLIVVLASVMSIQRALARQAAGAKTKKAP